MGSEKGTYSPDQGRLKYAALNWFSPLNIIDSETLFVLLGITLDTKLVQLGEKCRLAGFKPLRHRRPFLVLLWGSRRR